MPNRIIVFTLNGCGHCVELKNMLNEQTIPFTEIEISQNQQIWDQVVSQTGHNSLPTVFVSMDEGEDGPVFIPERDFKDKNELIEKIKLYI
jgi:glutaredoxin